MSLTPTAVLFGLSAVILGVGVWNDRRPWQPGKLNLFWAMFAGAVGCLVFGIHLVNLLIR